MRNDTCQHEEELAAGLAGLTNESEQQRALLEVERQLQAREIECDIRSARVKEEERERRELKVEQEAAYAEQVRKVEELAAELRKERELLSREREEVAKLRQVREAFHLKPSDFELQGLPDAALTEDIEDESRERAESSAELASALGVREVGEQIEKELLVDGDLGDAEEEVAELVETQETPEAEPERRRPAQVSNSASDEEQSIEDYMAGLLNRMRGGAPAPAVVAPEPKRNKRKSDPAPASEQPKAPENAHAAVRVQQVVDMPMGLTELTRRPQPPQVISYAAMRELANNQARIAIDTHGKKELLKATLINSGLAIACFAGTLTIFTTMPNDVPGLRTGSMAVLVGGVYWLLEAVVAGKELCAEVEVEAKVATDLEPSIAEGQATP